MKAYWVFYLRPKNFISIIINQILKQKWSGTEKSLDIKVELPPPPPLRLPTQGKTLRSPRWSRFWPLVAVWFPLSLINRNVLNSFDE